MPGFQEIFIAFVLIGFFFETDVHVCLVQVSELNQSQQPFGYIPKVKRQNQHFELLSEVYSLMQNDSL